MFSLLSYVFIIYIAFVEKWKDIQLKMANVDTPQMGRYLVHNQKWGGGTSLNKAWILS